MAGIQAIGVALPRYRVDSETVSQIATQSVEQFDERAVPPLDDDAATLGAEAATGPVDAATSPIRDVVTTSTSFQGQSIGAELCRAHGSLADATPIDIFGTSRALVNALSDGGKEGARLLVGADVTKFADGGLANRIKGAGAGAVLLAEDGELRVDGTGTATTNFQEYALEDGYWTEVADAKLARRQYSATAEDSFASLIEKVGCDGSDFHHAVINCRSARTAKSIQKRLGLREVAVGHVRREYGDLGAAAPLIGLHDRVAEAEPGDRILVLGSGFGGCAAAGLKVTGEVPTFESGVAGAKTIDIATYLQYAEGR